MVLQAFRLRVFAARRTSLCGTGTLLVACSLCLCALTAMRLCAASQADSRASKTTRTTRWAAPRKTIKAVRSSARRSAAANGSPTKSLRTTRRTSQNRTSSRTSARQANPEYTDGGSLARRASSGMSSPKISASRTTIRKRALSPENARGTVRIVPRKAQPRRAARTTPRNRKTQNSPHRAASQTPPAVVKMRASRTSQPRRKWRNAAAQSTLAPTMRVPEMPRRARDEWPESFRKTASVSKHRAAKRLIVEQLKLRSTRAQRIAGQRHRASRPAATRKIADGRGPVKTELKRVRAASVAQSSPQRVAMRPVTARNRDDRVGFNDAGSSANADGWRVELLGEEPTGIYWDRQTLFTRTSILFSLRLHNAQSEARPATLLWRILDLNGREVWRREGRFAVGARRLLHRRELFEAPERGAYLLQVEVRSPASARQKRRRDVSVALPFALSMAPASGFRPRSFFGLNAAALLSPNELGFYARIGARVLRSPWLPQNAGESLAMDEGLRARLERNLATVGVLHPSLLRPSRAGGAITQVASPGNANGAAGEWNWTRQVLAPLARWPLVSRWEIGGFDSAQRRADLGQTVQNLPLQANPIAFSFADEAALNASPALDDGWAVATDWPAFSGPGQAAPHPIAAQRMLARRKSALRRPLHVVDDSRIWQPGQSPDREDTKAQIGQWAARYLTAVMTGAASFSAALDDGDDTAFSQSTLKRTAPQFAGGFDKGSHSLSRFARAAAFSTMTRVLEDTSFESDLFASSPVLCGALFRGRSENVLAIWTAPHQNGQAARGWLRLRIPRDTTNAAMPVRALDVFGNEKALTTGTDLSVAVGPEPIYIATARSVEALRAAGREATLTRSDVAAVQVLPLSQGFPAARQVVRVRVQNVAPQTLSGQVQIVPPANWQLRANTISLRLEAGQSRVLSFVATHAPATRDGAYAFEVIVRSTAGSLRRRHILQVATASNWQAGQRVRVDGNLSEWRDAVWLSGEDIQSLSSLALQKAQHGKTQHGKPSVAPARVALRWDATRLYIAAKIIEPRLRVRRAGETAYSFWRGDALQMGFGVREVVESDAKYFDKAASAAHDTDYGFLICPFGVGATGIIEGRVLRLWSPTLLFGARLDALRWGGVVPGSSCAVRRDERANVTSYEAAIPLSQIHELRPAARALPLDFGSETNNAARLDGLEKPVRFGWIAHDDTLPPRLWPAPAAALPWQLGASSFLPVNNALPTATALLGWTARGTLVSDATQISGATKPHPIATRAPSTQRSLPVPTVVPASTPAPTVAPILAPTIAPTVKPRPIKPRPRPTEAPPARRFSIPEVLPMPPSILPPAAPPPGEQIAPRLPS